MSTMVCQDCELGGTKQGYSKLAKAEQHVTEVNTKFAKGLRPYKLVSIYLCTSGNWHVSKQPRLECVVGTTRKGVNLCWAERGARATCAHGCECHTTKAQLEALVASWAK